MGEKFWHLKNCSLFERLTAEQIQRVEVRSRSKTFDRGNLIYLPSDFGEAVFLLISGRIKLYHNTADGKQALLALIEPGELFGELAVLENGTREEFAEASETSVVVMIPGEIIQNLMEEHASVSLGVTKLMGLRRQRVERRLKSLLFRSNRERLVHLLLELAEKYGRSTSEGVQLTIKLSHQDLASIIGSTRETVTVLLGDLQLENLVSIKRRQITIRKLDRLADSIGEPTPVIPTELKVNPNLLQRTQVES